LGYRAAPRAGCRSGGRREPTEEKERGAKQAVATAAIFFREISAEIAAQIIAPLTAIKQNSPLAWLCYNAFIRRAQAKCNSAS
jgi:hypothetical protein